MTATGSGLAASGGFHFVEDIMEKHKRELNEIQEGLAAGLPVVIGYFPIALAFGILASTVGIRLGESVLFSLLVFAGASQFMALNLIAAGAGVYEVILATLLVNFRHFLMSASFSARLGPEFRKHVPWIAFGLTDEVFSVASFRQGGYSTRYLLFLELSAWGSWVGGTAVGYVAGTVLPLFLQNALGIALYAMFTALLIPEARNSGRILILALLSGGLNTLFSWLGLFSQGWNLVLAVILASLAGALLPEEELSHE